ncbi:MAG: hypothetical protein O7F09_06725 [Chloroflexi bacterium]|nr:hypothetical protein [Chloroflexota bacterium]
MSPYGTTSQKWLRAAQLTAISAVGGLLVAMVAFLIWESTWVDHTTSPTPRDNFLYGTIGTEFMPLPVLQVLPDLFPDRFQPAGPEGGDWVQQFGFIEGTPGVNDGLPLGLATSHYRPQTGAPSPMKFVGFSCALCHTSKIKRFEGDDGVIVTGMGSTSLDLFAWIDAVQGALLDEERLSIDSVKRAYGAKFGKSLGLSEELIIRLWLAEARRQLKVAVTKYDEPRSGAELRDANYMLNGPGRTQPFREILRLVKDRPGATDRAFTKFIAVYEQGNREWAQVDGSVNDPVSRSVLASVAAGATPENLLTPGIRNSLTTNVGYVAALKGPSYLEVFSELGITIDQEKAERGRDVYMRNCASCHGYPDGDGRRWVKGERQGEVVPHEEIGTDAERVTFRYYDVVADDIFDHFPDGHPLRPPRESLRPGPLGTTRGYINAPLESVFTRAPYLHNASVLTMAELLNLKPRRDVFYRGDSLYDPEDMGLLSPNQPDGRHYYEFDTTKRGNSNKGHDYPWAYRGPGWDAEALEDLLEYLKAF